MKRIIMLFVAVAFAATTVFAQGKAKGERTEKSPAERADSCANRMERSLGLNAEQKSKVRSLAFTQAEKTDALHEKYKGSDADKDVWRAERKKVHEEFKEGLKITLSADQYAKWEEQKKAHAHHRHHGSGKQGKGKCSKGDSVKPHSDSVPRK